MDAPHSHVQTPAVAPEEAPARARAAGGTSAGGGSVSGRLASIAIEPRFAADSGTRARAALGWQHGAGNAALQRAVVQRVPRPHGAVVQRDGGLTPEQQARLDNAQQLITKAAANTGAAGGALKAYADGAPGKIAAVQSNFDAGVALYMQASDIVNRKVELAKKLAAVRNEVLLMIIDKASGPVIGKLADLAASVGGVVQEISGKLGELKEAVSGLKDSEIASLVEPLTKQVTEPAGAAAKKAAGLGGPGPAGGSGAPPWAQELEFYKSMADVQGKGAGLLALANAVAAVNGPVGQIGQAIKDTRVAGRELATPIDKIEKEAASLEGGTRGLAGAAPRASGLLAELETMAALAAASAPVSADEVEKELWVRWAAGLDPTDADILDESPIEDYLRSKGIWDQLGIQTGAWFSSDEEGLAVASARAQAKVLEHKGEEVTIHVAGGVPLADAQLAGLPPLPASLGDSTMGASYDADVVVRGAVVGAQTNRTLDTAILKKNANIDLVIEELLRGRAVTVVLRTFEIVENLRELKVPEGVPEGGAADAKPAPPEGARPAEPEGAEPKGAQTEPPGQKPVGGPLSAADRSRLDNAQQLLDKAGKSSGAAGAALRAYADGAPGKIAGLQAGFDAGLALYMQAADIVNRKVELAKRLAAVRTELLLMIINTASGPVTGQLEGLTEGLSGAAGAIREKLVELKEAISALQESEIVKDVEPLTKQVTEPAAGGLKKAAGLGGAPSGGAAGAPPWAQELAFYKSIGEVQGKGAGLLGLANAVGSISGPIGQTSQLIKDTKVAGRELTSPIEKIEKDAANLEGGCRGIAAAAPTVSRLLGELDRMATLAAASAPKDVDEVEKELWIRWAAGLDPTDAGILDETGIEDYLRSKGIWDRLGIQIGEWFSSDEQGLAVVSARAETKVLEHKGEEVTMHVAGGIAMDDVRLPGLPALPASMGDSTLGATSDAEAIVRAVVVGAQMNRTLDTAILKKNANVELVIQELLRERFVTVVLRSFEVVRDLREVQVPESTPEPLPEGTGGTNTKEPVPAGT